MERDELHELVTALKDGIKAGDIELHSPRLLRSLEAVRFAADGIVDPATVNGDVRAAALAAVQAKAARDISKIPLREAQAEYFDILELFFGEPFSQMRKHGVSPAEVAEHLAGQESILRAFESERQEFSSAMHEFWDHYGPVVDLHLSQLKGLKSVFGGDIFPASDRNIACSIGLYMDTIVLPDPLLRILKLGVVSSPRETLRLITKHALSALSYRELALAELDPPIVVITADPLFLDPLYGAGLTVSAETDVLKHTRNLFGQEFPTVQELQLALNHLAKNEEELIKQLADTRRFLFDAEWSDQPSDQFKRYVSEIRTSAPGIANKPIADMVYDAFFGRMMQTNDLLLRSAKYEGTPLIDAPTSWQYLLWKYEYDSESSVIGTQEVRDSVISRAVVSEGNTEFGMLSGVPPEALIELRKNGAMSKLRETLRGGIQHLDLASPDLLPKVADEVIANIDRSFEAHDRELRNLSSSRRKFYGWDVGRWIVGGGISVAAAALSHNLALKIIGALAPKTIGSPSIPDLRKRWRELEAQRQDMQRSPTAILFRHLSPKFGFSRG